jgi:hypothetical protein
MIPDRRDDHTTRDRYDELAASWHSAVQRLDARYRRVVVGVLVVAVITIGNVGFGLLLLKRVGSDADATTRAICALRQDLERRVDSSQTILTDHPKGIAGIPAATIRKGISDQKRTIKALSGLDCA